MNGQKSHRTEEALRKRFEAEEQQAIDALARWIGHPAVRGIIGRRRIGAETVVIIGTPPGSGLAIVRYRAMPFCWPPWHPDLWRMLIWGSLLARGRGSLATHKKLDRLQERANFVDQSFVSPAVIEPGDRHRPPPPRDRWWLAIRTARLVPRAGDLRCPVLLIVGRHDPQTPVRVSRALHARIGGSRLVIFERSGHSPFIEEPERFAQVLTGFLR